MSILSSSFRATPRYVSYCPHFTDGNLEAPRSQASQEVELSLEPGRAARGTYRCVKETIVGCTVRNLPNCTWETPPGGLQN